MMPRVGCRSQNAVGSVPLREVLGVDHRAALELAVVVDHLDVLAAVGRQLARHPADAARW